VVPCLSLPRLRQRVAQLASRCARRNSQPPAASTHSHMGPAPAGRPRRARRSADFPSPCASQSRLPAGLSRPNSTWGARAVPRPDRKRTRRWGTNRWKWDAAERRGRGGFVVHVCAPYVPLARCWHGVSKPQYAQASSAASARLSMGWGARRCSHRARAWRADRGAPRAPRSSHMPCNAPQCAASACADRTHAGRRTGRRAVGSYAKRCCSTYKPCAKAAGENRRRAGKGRPPGLVGWRAASRPAPHPGEATGAGAAHARAEKTGSGPKGSGQRSKVVAGPQGARPRCPSRGRGERRATEQVGRTGQCTHKSSKLGCTGIAARPPSSSRA
jgi:hypothetical protein